MHLKLYVIVFFLFSFVGLSQNNVLNLSVSNSNPEAGEAFEISVKSSVNGSIQLVLPSEFISGGAMSGMSQQITNSTRSTIYYKTEMGHFPREGEFVIGPAKIRSGNKIYTSNKLTIKVSSIGKSGSTSQSSSTSKNLSDRSAFGLIETNKTSVYIGEPIRINARVYAQFEPRSFEDYKEYVSKGFPDKQKIPNPDMTNVEMKNYQSKRFYSFSYDKSICFPTETGTFTIQPFQMTLGNIFDQEKIISETAAIIVKPLPGTKPSSFTGAVGKVKMERIVKKGAKKQGDVAIVSFIFTGTGNIHSIEIPDLKLPTSIQLYGDPEIKEDFEFNENGAEGKLTIDYNLQMLDPGKLLIPTFEFSYFDLETEQFISSFADSIYFDVVQTPGFDRKKAQEEANKRLTSKKNKKENQDSTWSSKVVLVSIGTGVLALSALMFLFFRKRNLKNENERKPFENKEENSVKLNKIVLPNTAAVNAKFDLRDLETKIDSPSEYIKSLSEKIDAWLDGVVKSNESVQLSRMEKLEVLKSDPNWSEDITTISSIFHKIDEARYGLTVDSFYCQQIQEKLVEIFNK
jgi:hypothetical protein